jgi:hypothetical protein
MTLDELAETAVGVLGDSIDADGSGWDGRPWFMLLGAGGELMTFAAAGAALADQLPGVAEVLRAERPVACAFVKLAGVAIGGRMAGPAGVLVALDGEGSQRNLVCELVVADDGRQLLQPLDQGGADILPGVLDAFTAEALALVRAGAGSPEWDALVDRARSALDQPG